MKVRREFLKLLIEDAADGAYLPAKYKNRMLAEVDKHDTVLIGKFYDEEGNKCPLTWAGLWGANTEVPQFAKEAFWSKFDRNFYYHIPFRSRIGKNKIEVIK